MKRLKIILPAITLIMIGVIWGHSMMPGEVSASESGLVFKILSAVFGDGVITDHLVRKAAHFTEYMVLGILCCADFAIYGRGGFKYVLLPLYICLFTAVADESIQLFTVGRSGMLFDVWLDHAGSITGSIIFNVINTVIKRK